MMQKCIWLAAILLLNVQVIYAQNGMQLNDILERAVQTSVYAKLSQTERDVSEYAYQSFKSELRPQISFSGSLPNYSKSFSAITQPDGSIKFLPISQHLGSAGLSLGQVIPATGGTLSLNTSLARFDDFNSGSKQYNATPVFIALSQPLGAYNSIKWSKRIEPLRYMEARKNYLVEIENLKLEACSLFFAALQAQNMQQLARQNLLEQQHNYALEKSRIPLGTSSSERMMQLELEILTAQQQMQQAGYQLKIAILNLKVLTGITAGDSLFFELPGSNPAVYPEVSAAIGFAKLNRPEYIAFERKRLEAQSELARARAEKYQVDISSTMGYNNSDPVLKGAYEQLKPQLTFGITFDIPIIDWGRRDAKIKTAKAALKLQEYKNQVEENNLVQEVTTLVESLLMLQVNLSHSEKVQLLAQKRYMMALENYRLGKYSITDLTIAQQQKDDARKNYISALGDYWQAHYKFRKITGYDPVLNQSIKD